MRGLKLFFEQKRINLNWFRGFRGNCFFFCSHCFSSKWFFFTSSIFFNYFISFSLFLNG